MDVEFSISKETKHGKTTLNATFVTMPGGANICIQDEADAEKKEFVGGPEGQMLRYTGTLKFFSPKNGFGYITIDPGYVLDAEIYEKELRVETAEVNAGGNHPPTLKELNVEFGIWKTKKGSYKAYNMTLPGVVPLTVDVLDNRQVIPGRVFRGKVEMWFGNKGFGFIAPAPGAVFPPAFQAKQQQSSAEAAAKGKTIQNENFVYFRKEDCDPSMQVDREVNVQFSLYTDDRGCGGCSISAA